MAESSLEGPLPYLYTKGAPSVKSGVVSEGEMPWRMEADMIVNYVVDLCLLISHRELRQRSRGCSYA
jgi:hypothetical protein